MNWWILVIAVIVILIFVRYKEMRHKFGIIAIVIVLLFFVASFGMVYMSYDLSLKSFDGVVNAGKVYVSWLGAAISNIGTIGGYAIKQDWSAEGNKSLAVQKQLLKPAGK